MTSIDLVTLVVADYDAAIRFFVDAIDFELTEDTPATTDDGRPKRWVVVRPKSGGTGLLLARADGPEQVAAVGRQTAGRVGFFLQVGDADLEFARMTAAGVEFLEPLRRESYGSVAVFLDCEGNRWDLIGPPPGVEYRDLARHELSRIGEIDRSEDIDTVIVQRGTELVERSGSWNATPWDPYGSGEHSVGAQHVALLGYVDAGGIARGAFAGGRLVGIGVVVPHVRPGVARLAYLHVSRTFRAAGIGSRLATDLDRIAREAGHTEMVLTATPSRNTVHFYLHRGFRPTAEPFPELLELEPDDVHMHRRL